jgi:hypothetical protein
LVGGEVKPTKIPAVDGEQQPGGVFLRVSSSRIEDPRLAFVEYISMVVRNLSTSVAVSLRGEKERDERIK